MFKQCVYANAGTSEPQSSATGSESHQHSGQSQRIRTVFLFTDGQATTGVTNNERLKQILSVMLQNAISPTIYCFGYGNNFSTDALDSISQAGQGSSCFIEDAEAIPGALASALGGLMSMSAQNVELTFMPQVISEKFSIKCIHCLQRATCSLSTIHMETLSDSAALLLQGFDSVRAVHVIYCVGARELTDAWTETMLKQLQHCITCLPLLRLLYIDRLVSACAEV